MADVRQQIDAEPDTLSKALQLHRGRLAAARNTPDAPAPMLSLDKSKEILIVLPACSRSGCSRSDGSCHSRTKPAAKELPMWEWMDDTSATIETELQPREPMIHGSYPYRNAHSGNPTSGYRDSQKLARRLACPALCPDDNSYSFDLPVLTRLLFQYCAK